MAKGLERGCDVGGKGISPVWVRSCRAVAECSRRLCLRGASVWDPPPNSPLYHQAFPFPPSLGLRLRLAGMRWVPNSKCCCPGHLGGLGHGVHVEPPRYVQLEVPRARVRHRGGSDVVPIDLPDGAVPQGRGAAKSAELDWGAREIPRVPELAGWGCGG